MENNVNINELAQKFFAARGEETYCDLFGAVFALPEWHFIADGEFPNLSAYCAVFPGFFDDQPAVLTFTDKEKLNKYVASKNLQLGSPDKPITLNSFDTTVKFSSENLILSIPTMSVIDYLERLAQKGVKWIVFNQNKDSVGFDLGLSRLRETKELLDSKKPQVEAAEIDESGAKIDFDALARKSNGSGGALADLNDLFGETFALEKWIFIARGELPNVNPYVAANADYAGGQQMIRAFTDSNRLQRFAKENNLTDADGAAQMLEIPVTGAVEYLEQFVPYSVHGVWFNSDTQSDGYFIPLAQLRPIREHLAQIGWKSTDEPTNPELKSVSEAELETDIRLSNQANAAQTGSVPVAQNAADDKNAVDYIDWFRRGTIKSDTTFKPFFQAIAPLLADFSGVGEFEFSFATGSDEPGMRDLFEDVSSNSHGAYLKYRSYIFEPYEMQMIGSNRLTNVRTGETLRIQLTMHKNLADQKTTLIVVFVGWSATVETLENAVKSAFSDAEYKVQLQTKKAATTETLQSIGVQG